MKRSSGMMKDFREVELWPKDSNYWWLRGLTEEFRRSARSRSVYCQELQL